MPKKSAASLTIVPAGRPGDLPPPPGDLLAAEAATWREIVESKPADWFGPDSLPILKEYVRAVAMCDTLARMVERAAADGEGVALVKSLLDMRDKEARRAASMATKLRLTQQSRYGARSADRADQRVSGKRPWQA
jgi:hypothetical protein